MKTLALLSTIFFFAVNLNSQIISEGPSAQFLFQDFIKGKVLMKNGEVHQLLLNYNTLSEKIVYKQSDKNYDLMNQDSADTIYLQHLKFISSSGVLYQVLLSAKVPFFVHYEGKLIPPGTPAGYGENSQVSNTKIQTSFSTSSGSYNLDLPADYKVRIDLTYSIILNETLIEFSNQREFLKIFPGKADDLKGFIRKNKIKFNIPADIEKLAKYFNNIVG
jgi:hypothetical protein